MIHAGRGLSPTYTVETPGELRMRIKPDGNSARFEQCWCVQTRDKTGQLIESKWEWREVKQVSWDGMPIT
jgi:hypothetical protein